jgi:predicted kinase
MKFTDFLAEKDYLLSESINDKGIFKAVYMAGHSGAGKSYTLDRIKSGSIEPRIVNVDKYVEHFGRDYEQEFYDKSKYLLMNQLNLYIDSILPLAVDVTAASPNAVVRRYGIFDYFGYDQAMVFVNCSLQTALDRAGQRQRKVPPEVVTNYYNEVQKIKGYLKQKFGTFIEVNNDIGELTDEVVLAAFRKMESFYNSPIKNKRGQEAVQIMTENKWKYLSDGIFDKNEINSMVRMWYSG